MSHGVFMNDVPLRPTGPALAEAFAAEGYDTAYTGTWHVVVGGRSSWIPPERRFGFRYRETIECTYDDRHSAYFAGDSDRKLQ